MKTINKFVLVLLLSLPALSLFGKSDPSFGFRRTEAPMDTFVQRVNGTGLLTAAIQAVDGTYVTASKINSLSFLVRKIKASGQKQWERRLDFQDNAYNPDAFINEIAQTTDGGFVLSGRVGCRLVTDCGYSLASPITASSEFAGFGGAILVKLRPNGTIAWGKSLGALVFTSVSSTSDGGVIATGKTGGAEYIAKFNGEGGVIWEKSFRNATLLAANSLSDFHSAATADNAVIITFQTFALRNNVITPTGVDVMKVTDSGSVIWEKLLKSDGFVFQSMGTTANQGVILIGTSLDSNKLRVVVMRANGTISWKAGYFLKVPGKPTFVSSPVQTSDGGYIVTGTTRSGAKLFGFIAKIDSSQKIAFQNTFGASGGLVFGTADGGFLLFADLASDILISKVNSEANAGSCSFFRSLGPTTNTSFGSLRINEAHTPSGDVSFSPVDLGLSSVVTNHPVTNICH